MTRAVALPAADSTRPFPVDAALPQLELLFDEKQAQRLIAEALGERRTEATIEYVRYKPQTSCLILYGVGAPGGCRHVYARATSINTDFESSPGATLSLPDLHLELIDSYADRRIRGLRALRNTAERKSMLERLIREPDRAAFETDWGKWESVRYKPERRAVFSGATAEGKRYFVRFYAGKQGERTAAVVRGLRGSAECVGAIGRRLRYSQSYRALFTTKVPGAPLDTIPLESAERSAGACAAARALRELHRRPADFLAGSTASPRKLAANAATGLSAVLPAAHSRARMLAKEILPRLEDSPAPPCLIHGDFDESQVLVEDAGRAHLLDFDEARPGNPMEDVAGFFARLVGRTEATETDAAIRSAAGFVEAYEQARGWRLPKDQLSAWTALSLLRLAVEPFRGFQSDWPRGCDRILILAEKALRGGLL